MEQLCSCPHRHVDILLYQKVDESDTCLSNIQSRPEKFFPNPMNKTKTGTRQHQLSYFLNIRFKSLYL